jgi:hypothetical protein
MKIPIASSFVPMDTRVNTEMARISESFVHRKQKEGTCTVVISPDSYDILHDVVHEFNSKYPYTISTTVIAQGAYGHLLFDSEGIRRQKERFKQYKRLYVTVDWADSVKNESCRAHTPKSNDRKADTLV